MKNKKLKALDYHEGMSPNQVEILCRELNLDFKKFSNWIGGQTCPIIIRHNKKGEQVRVCGVYEYDVFRWVENQKKGTALVWD